MSELVIHSSLKTKCDTVILGVKHARSIFGMCFAGFFFLAFIQRGITQSGRDYTFSIGNLRGEVSDENYFPS